MSDCSMLKPKTHWIVRNLMQEYVHDALEQRSSIERYIGLGIWLQARVQDMSDVGVADEAFPELAIRDLTVGRGGVCDGRS